MPFRSLVAVSCAALMAVTAAPAAAEPDEAAQLASLSRKAERAVEDLYTARIELGRLRVEVRDAQARHDADRAAADAADRTADEYRQRVNRFAAGVYMGGGSRATLRTVLAAESPGALLSRLSVERMLADDFPARMEQYRQAQRAADAAEVASAASARAADEAVSRAERTYTDIQASQRAVRSQMDSIRARHAALTGSQPTLPEPPTGDDPSPPEEFRVDDASGLDPHTETAPPEVVPVADAVEPGSGRWGSVVSAALAQVGTPYVWGGETPGRGFDCSGLVMWAFRQAGVALPHSSQAMARSGQAVSASDMQPGDVVTYYSDASHVGLYIGDGMVVHAPTYGQPVTVVPLASSGPVHNVRRL